MLNRVYRRCVIYFLCGVGIFTLLCSLPGLPWRNTKQNTLQGHNFPVVRFIPSPKSHLKDDITVFPPRLEPHTFTVLQSLTQSYALKPHPSYRDPHPFPSHFHNLTEDEISSVEKFVFFVGYGRSGHSLVASIMDAHPNVIIAHEYYLFDKLLSHSHSLPLQTKANLFDELFWNSYNSAAVGWRSLKETSKGYNFGINGSWQGQFKKLKVIGDKTGGATAMLYHTSPELFKAALKKLNRITGVPHQVVHVVRNPYDMISTVALYQASLKPDYIKVNATIEKKFNDLHYLKLGMDIILNKAAAVRAMARDCQFKLLEIHLEDLIKDSRKVVREICDFLDVLCEDSYVEACQKKVYKRASRSRDLVMWPKDLYNQVEETIKKYKFFQRYSFEGTTNNM